MGRLWNKWLVPALFAVILFLCIRVANDIPKHEYYWESNEWNFMLKDMLVVLFMSYPIFFLLYIKTGISTHFKCALTVRTL